MVFDLLLSVKWSMFLLMSKVSIGNNVVIMMVVMFMMLYFFVDRYRVYNGISMNVISLVVIVLSLKMLILISKFLYLFM